jgi:putative transposase
MARMRRFEAAGAVFHLLNRGNYRRDIFVESPTKASVLKCLDETCLKTGWRLFAWTLMINHYHQAAQTPEPNLAEGMKWLQGTFANRFNGIRHERGHLFQGRYKSIRIDPETRLGPLCHYIHLNPVRAKVLTVDELADYPWNSLSWLMHPRRRASWYEPQAALEHAGHLDDTASGRKQYLEYLRWLASDDVAQKAQCFELMAEGWMQGSPEFLRELAGDFTRAVDRMPAAQEEARTALHAAWAAQAQVFLHALGKTLADTSHTKKSEPWKLAVAAAMKATTIATNRWLAAHLHLGALHEASRNVSAWQQDPAPALRDWLRRQITHHKI